jgi:hypothetical protein
MVPDRAIRRSVWIGDKIQALFCVKIRSPMGIKGRAGEFLFMERKKAKKRRRPHLKRFGMAKCGDCQEWKSMV